MKKTYTLLPLSIATIALGLSFASADNASLTASTQGNRLTLSTSLNTNIDGKLYDDEDSNSVSAQSNTTLNVNVNASGTATTNSNGAQGSSSPTMVIVNTGADAESNFEIDGDIERSDTTATFSLNNAFQVSTGSDLRIFARALAHQHPEIRAVVTAEDRVSVTRTLPAKLFGFININGGETVEVVSWGDGTQQINVNRPWWNIFSKNDVTTADVSSDIEARIKNIPSTEFGSTLSAATKARIIAEIQAMFAANTSTSATAN